MCTMHGDVALEELRLTSQFVDFKMLSMCVAYPLSFVGRRKTPFLKSGPELLKWSVL